MTEVKFPNDIKGKNYTIEFYQTAEPEFNKHLEKMQKYQDKRVSESLMKYVSFRDGIQESSIKRATVLGSGYVIIDVKYAEYQAYSFKIKKRVGKRGTKPFERMVSDNKSIILNEMQKLAEEL